MAVHQGGIYWVDLDPTRGREQRGRRPALVISRDELNALPLTVLIMIGASAEHFDTARRYPTDVWVTSGESGLPKDTVFMGLQIRSIDPSRLGTHVGTLPAHRMQQILDVMGYILGNDRWNGHT